MKRIFDFLFSLLIILIFLPLGIIIILILKLTGEREIFYIQERVGKNENIFGLIKFVTMLKNSPNMGSGDITLKEDPRVLPFGKLLRKTKVNEFPQFLNVLLGEMSLVGPRPLVKRQYNMIPESLKEKISYLKPGVTGIGSVIFRDEESYLNKAGDDAQKFYKDEIVPFKAELENWYYKNANIIVDLMIIVLTIFAVILPKIKLHFFLFPSLPKHKIFNYK